MRKEGSPEWQERCSKIVGKRDYESEKAGARCDSQEFARRHDRK